MSEEQKNLNAVKDSESKCDCGEEACDCEEYGDIVELVDDDGNTLKFVHVATIDYENKWYVFFSPTEEVEGVTTDEVVIFRLDSDKEGKDVFSPIEDEELLQKVYDEYVKIMEEDEETEENECKGTGCDGCCGCSH